MLYRAILCLLFVVLVIPVAADGQKAPRTGTFVVRAKSITWYDLDIPGFAKGVQFISIYGDSAVAGGDYTIRLKFPDGYVLPPHYHPRDVNWTVLSGAFTLGHGANAPTLPLSQRDGFVPGDFFNIPATRPHYGQVKGETVVQLHGVAPFEFVLAK